MSAPVERCPACNGTGILMGLQWGSAEWPGCEVCAPDFLCIGVVDNPLPGNIPPPGIGCRRPYVGSQEGGQR